MGFRDSIKSLCPTWLQDFVGERVMFAMGIELDALETILHEGMRAHFPNYGPTDALFRIGNDRNLERGPAQTNDGFRTQLRRAIDAWRIAGSPRAILRQLAAYFAGIGTPPMRTVTDASIWHLYDYLLNDITKATDAGWDWDSFTGIRWWRGWIIIDSSAGPWTTWDIGGGHIIGESNLTIGSTASPADVQSIGAVVRKWKPANVRAMFVIVTFDTDLFTPGSTPMPGGDYDDPLNRDERAAYWELSI